MSPATNYTKGVEIGELMQGGGVGEVVASNHPKWKAGDIAESMSFGWQEWSVLTPDVSGPAGVNRIDPNLAPIESSLSWLGMPGITAYFGLLELGRPRPGDTVVVSAASGAVGQLVGQIAKLAGCRAVAIAGNDDKLKWCQELGFDVGINYKKATDLTQAVKEASCGGVDVFFDNTAGAIHDAVMKNLRTLVSGSWVSSSSHGPASMDFWHSTGGTDGRKPCSGFPNGNAREKFGSRKMCWTASSACPKHSFGC
jgi:NADPH-dependent curcumin reductase CurA